MARTTLTHQIGTSRSFAPDIRDAQRQLVTSYTAANPLRAEVWRGDDQAVLAVIPVTWVDPTQGAIALTIGADDVLGLEPGTYRLRIVVTDELGDHLTHDLDLKLTAAPGSGTPPPVYGTADELQVYFAGVDKLRADSDETGFAEQRAESRRWIDRVIVAHWSPGSCRWAGGLGWQGSPRDTSYIKGLLAADKLIVDDTIRTMAALKAAAIVLGAQLPDAATVAAGRQSAYQQLGARYAAQATALARSLVAELDTNDDGQTDLWIDCTSLRPLRG